MKNLFPTLLLPAIILADEPVALEQGGLVSVEAEAFVRQTKNEVRAWHITGKNSIPDLKPDADPPHIDAASGGAYVEILPDTRATHDDKLIKGENFTNAPGEMAILHYPIRITKPGRYYVWARAFSTGTEDNGLHFGLDGEWPESGQRWQTVKKHSWQWDCKQRTEKVHIGVPMQLWLDIDEPGDHELLLGMREDGAEVDKIILARSPDFRPGKD